MPPLFSGRQPAPAAPWFEGAAGRAVLASQAGTVREALAERPAPPWLWLAPGSPESPPDGRGVLLVARTGGWDGDLRCDWPLPIASEALGTVVLQHVGDLGRDCAPLLEECARTLVPGGRLWLFALNPLTPYRRHWRGSAVACAEPVTWRRRLRAAGLEPEPVSAGLGPRWEVAVSAQRQHGAGMRASFLLRAHKRVAAFVPPAPMPAMRWQPGLPAT